MVFYTVREFSGTLGAGKRFDVAVDWCWVKRGTTFFKYLVLLGFAALTANLQVMAVGCFFDVSVQSGTAAAGSTICDDTVGWR